MADYFRIRNDEINESSVAAQLQNGPEISLTKTTQHVLYLLLICFSIGATASVIDAQAQSSPSREFWDKRQKLQADFSATLNPLIQQCQQQGIESAAEVLQQFVIKRDPQRQYIFLPSENRVGDDGLQDLPEELKAETAAVLLKHAQSLFELAKAESKLGNGATAFQLLHEVLFFDPNHETVRNILGHRVVDDDQVKKWRVQSDRLKIKKATKPFEDLGWPAGTYLTASTSHFQISSRTSESETRILAENLERWHEVWRQVFFEYYNRSENLSRWIDGKGKRTVPRRKFNVVFFANKADYVAGLSQSVPGVEVSTGFYHDGQKTSYFYASNDLTIRDTWRHELTHQLFQESKRSVHSPFQEEFLWLGEGIAMYFESLADHGEYLTVGGFDARRLQYARLRRIKEQFRIPLEQLSSQTRDEFQSQDHITKVYSQSAGVTHYLMNADHGAMRKPLIDFLQLSYQGKLKPGTFEKVVGRSFEQVDRGYETFLNVRASQLNYLSAPETRTELVLPGIRLEDNTMSKLNQCVELEWLDLSGCNVSGTSLRFLKPCRQLRQLFLTGAIVDEDAVRIISQLPIKELDLSGSSITDTELKILGKSKSLKTLNLAGTKVSASAVSEFKSRRADIEVVAD